MGWIPVRGQHTCCYCLETDDSLIIFDAGTGMARFSEPWAKNLPVTKERILLFLSHYHLDHTVGLFYLTNFFKDKKIHIAGPGRSIYGSSVEDILDKIMAPPYLGTQLSNFPMDITFHDLNPGKNLIDGIEVRVKLQEHSDPSIGIRIDNTICYITDTSTDEATSEFSRNCRLLLHESWLDSEDYHKMLRKIGSSTPDSSIEKTLKSHSSAGLTAEIARKADVDQLILIHLNPNYETKRLLSMERDAQQLFPKTSLAKDGRIILL